jgi:DNA topoisomerase-3
MEGAGKLVEDDELREAMREKGLGTPATRAATIDGLVYEQYILRNGRELQATAKAFSLMELLNGLGIPELTKPELTGDWEFKLHQIQRRQKSRDEFMSEIADMTRHIVERAKKFEQDTIPGDFGVLSVPCPKCGGEVRERYKAFQCVKCDFSLWKSISGRMYEIEEAEALLRDKQIGPLQGFRSKLGKPFAAVLKLTPEFKIEFDFGQDNKNGGAVEMDFSGQEPLGKCPKCGARMFEAPMSYICEKATGPNRTCDFRTGKIILQQPIERAQVVKLLETGKTDLLDKFISKKNRPFKAFLVLDKGKVGFEFQPREKRPRKGSAAAKEPPVKVDFTGKEPIGKCPKCQGNIFEMDSSYICERSQAEKRPCKFKVSKNILQRSIEVPQVQKMLQDGKTDLLDNFISKSGKPFSAYLVMDDDGKVTFDFPPREEQHTT